jgi:fumarate reductase flavoprotein subunit
MRKLEANLVVIGAGGAGLCAALTALESGVTGVIVLEKRFVVGGNSSMAGGMIFAAESRQQKEAGVNISRDGVFKDTLAFHHYDKVNPHILRAFIDKSAGTVQWLENRGLPFEWSKGMGVHILKGVTTPFGGFSRATKVLAGHIKSCGGRILTHTTAKKILRDAQGRINGLMAVNKEGEEIWINTQSVILTTGGFTGNKALLKKYFPNYWDDVYWTDAIPLEGDGLQLAESAGAGLEDYCTLIRENGYCFDKSGKMPNRVHMQEGAVWVNRYGQRYADENNHDDASTNALLAQPGKIAFALFDDKLIRIANERPDPFSPKSGPTEKPPALNEIISAEAEEGIWSMVSANWDEIAGWIGADPSVLKNTVDEYNTFCDQGRDGLFAKDPRSLYPLRIPPFYAVKFRPLMVDTIGPVRIDERMEVLDKQDRPIPGLYAGGVITSGWQGNDYRLFGSALGYSLNSGRIAGENAVKYLSSER